MEKSYKRRHYLVEKGLQLRYMGIIAVTLSVIAVTSGIGLYFSIWGGVIDNFSTINVSQDLETAKRLSAYQEVRYHSTDSRLVQIFKEADLLSERQREQLAGILEAANSRLLPKMLLLVVIIAVGSIFLSHKIAGPVFRFEKSIKAMQGGDLTLSFNLRKDDELKDLAGDLNGMALLLRNKIIKIRSIIDETKNSQAVSKEQALASIEKELSMFKV